MRTKLRKRAGILGVLFLFMLSATALGIFAAPSKARGASVLGEWTPTAEAAGTMTVTNTAPGGVAEIGYSRIPATAQIYEEPSQNAVTIDVAGFSASADTAISIKYDTDTIEISRILLFAKTPTKTVLIAFFNGWNASVGASKDGYPFVTVKSFAGYTGGEEIIGLQLSLESSLTEETLESPHGISLLGVSFHSVGTQPVFATDPVAPEVGGVAAESGGTRYTKISEGLFSYTGQGNDALETVVTNWNANFRALRFTAQAAAGTKLIVYADNTALADYNNEDGIFRAAAAKAMYFTIPEEISAVGRIRFVFDPEGDDYAPNTTKTIVGISNIKFEANFAVGKPTFGDSISGSTANGVTTLSYTGESWANIVAIPLSNWNPTYDAFAVTVRARANTLLGISVQNGASYLYLRNHYSQSAIIESGEAITYVYYGLDKLGVDIGSIELWFDAPTGVNGDVNTGVTAVTISDIVVLQTALLPEPTVTANDLTVDYDGNPHPIASGVCVPEKPVSCYYKLSTADDSTYTDVPPTNGGTYTVKVGFDGDLEYRASYVYVTLTINRVAAPTPNADIVTLDYVNGKIVFDEKSVEVSRADDFSALLQSGTAFIEGETLHARNKETANYFTSDAITVAVPTRTDVALSMQDGEFTFDAAEKTLTAQSVPSGKDIVYAYKLASEDDTAYVETPPKNSGVYTVRATFLGTSQERTATVTATLTIKKAKAATPTLSDLTVNYQTERFTFDAALFKVSKTAEFNKDDLYQSNAQVPKGGTVYVMRIEDGNYLASDVATLVMPSANTAAPEIAVDFTRETTSVAITAAYEYRLGSSGSWTKGGGDFVPLLPENTYQFRFAPTSSAFASSATTLIVPRRASKPAVVSLEQATADSITVVGADGWEYRLGDDGQWQDSNVFTDLDANTEYKIFARVKATDSKYTSEENSAFLSTKNETKAGGCGTVQSSFLSGGGILVLALASALLAMILIRRRAKAL